MNDDFLRRARRSPSAAFEHQLRERLRQQELSETSRRRPSWKLLAISLLVGGTALATATYLTLTRAPSSSHSTQSAQVRTDRPAENAALETSRFDIPASGAYRSPEENLQDPVPSDPASQSSPLGVAQENRRPATESSSDTGSQSPSYISSTGLGTPGAATARQIRVVMSPDIRALARNTALEAKHASSVSFEIETADKTLPTLCARESDEQPDVVVVSRRARQKEFEQCKRRDYGEVLVTSLGHVATVVTRARTGNSMSLSTRSLRLAVLKKVPSPDNAALLIDNPYTYWNQIDPALEDTRIKVFGPARDSSEFVVFAATLLEPGCESFAGDDQHLCRTLREDGVYEEARFDNTLVGQRLWSDLSIVAILDYRFYASNSSDLLGSLLPGAPPTRESIIDGSYVGARTLHIYVNRLRYRNVPKVSSFVNEYLRSFTYLRERSMIPPDGKLDFARYYGNAPQLTEVKLD